MAFDAKSLIQKAKQEAEEKAKRAEEERLAAQKAEEERRIKEAEEKARKEKEEAERREKERLEREEKERIQREQERIRQEQEAEARRKQEEEEARLREQARIKAEEERNRRTQQCSSEMEEMNTKLFQYVTGKVYSYAQINALLNMAKELLNRDVDTSKIACYETFKNNVSTLENLAETVRQKERAKELKKKKVFNFIKTLFVLAVIGTLVVLVNRCRTSEAYINKQEQKRIEKINIKNEKQRIKDEKQKIKDAQNFEKTHQLGMKGEAGIIFYDKGSYSDGWRFLEVSSDVFEEVSFSSDSFTLNNFTEEDDKLGGGVEYTQALIAKFGDKCGAAVAANYHAGGKNDWYLGNEAEMKMLYKNLVANKRLRKRAKRRCNDRLYTTFKNYLGGRVYAYQISNYSEGEKVKLLIFSNNKFFLEGGSIVLVGYDWKSFSHNNFPGYKVCVRPIRKF